jgi:hypothetical protein
VRAAVPVVEAFRQGGREALSVRLGGDVGVVLVQGPGGIELALDVAPALARAARAELPGLARALDARGVRLARAEVRVRFGAAPTLTRPAGVR